MSAHVYEIQDTSSEVVLQSQSTQAIDERTQEGRNAPVIPLSNEERRVVEANCNLVRKVASSVACSHALYRGGFSYEDLTQEGFRGLIAAAKSHDEERGSFEKYAWTMIRGAMRHAIRDNSNVIKVRFGDNSGSYDQAREKLENAGIRITDETIAEQSGLSVEEAAEQRTRRQKLGTLSFDAAIPEPDTYEGGGEDMIGYGIFPIEDVNFERVVDRGLIDKLIGQLPAKLQTVVELRFGLNDEGNRRTLAEIATILGYSEMHASRLVKQALEAMRESEIGQECLQDGLV